MAEPEATPTGPPPSSPSPPAAGTVHVRVEVPKATLGVRQALRLLNERWPGQVTSTRETDRSTVAFLALPNRPDPSGDGAEDAVAAVRSALVVRGCATGVEVRAHDPRPTSRRPRSPGGAARNPGPSEPHPPRR